MENVNIMRNTILVLLLIGGAFPAFSEPRPYSVDRYRAIWDGASILVESSEPSGSTPIEGDWEVAGVFSFGDEDGAIVINRRNGSIEYLSSSSPSPSGLTLSQVFPFAPGSAPRISVVHRGEIFDISGFGSDPSSLQNAALSYAPVVQPEKRKPVKELESIALAETP
ncbi:MAG: hypothetical protein P1U85_15750 [Verrucomicrobiales bacterium]|nr:hypothetical protein [Verrucomicrobiales bacterium]